MNFTGPSDFQYVVGANVDARHPYGDLDRIVIDNDIMPVRNTEDKKIIRGMDIAFLMEATEERARAIGLDPSHPYTYTFSRNITISQINNLILRLNAVIRQCKGDAWKHYDGTCDCIALKHDSEHYGYLVPFSLNNEKIDTDEIDFVYSYSHALLRSKIEQMFSAIESIRFLLQNSAVCELRDGEYYPVYNVVDTTIGEVHGDSEYFDFSNQFPPATFYSYHSESYLTARAYAFASSARYEMGVKKLRPQQIDPPGGKMPIRLHATSHHPDRPNCMVNFTRTVGQQHDIISYDGSDILSATRAVVGETGEYPDLIVGNDYLLSPFYCASYYTFSEIAYRTRWDVDDDED